MLIWHAVLLALVQGLTEFLPVSSSAHLILMPAVGGWQDQGLSFDVAVHVGTLTAVLTYFRREVGRLFSDWVDSIRHRARRGESHIAWGVILGSIPLGIGGLLISRLGEDLLRSPIVLAVASIVFGVLLWWSDLIGQRSRSEHSLSLGDILFIGLAQAVALIPGTSRSGVTMTAGLVLGLTREAAARFSFLLSIPAIVMAGSYQGYKAATDPGAVDWTAMAVGALVSAVAAFLCIHVFLKLLERVGMLPFVIYRVVLGVVILLVVN